MQADKGNVTVVMDSKDYLNTVGKVMEKEKYIPKKTFNPIKPFSSKINQTILKIADIKRSPMNNTQHFFEENNNIISHESLKYFTRNNPQRAWIYNTPKIHNKDFETKHQICHITSNSDLTPGRTLTKKL